MFMFLTILTASLQVEVNALKGKVAAMHRGIDQDILSYDVRVSQAVQRLTRATFGDEAIRATPVPLHSYIPATKSRARSIGL